MFRKIYIYLVLIFFAFGNCYLFEKKDSAKDQIYENRYLIIQNSYTTIQSNKNGEFVVIDFLLNWKILERIDLIIRDKDSGIIVFENSVQAVPLLKLRSFPINVQLTKYKWLYENPNEDSIRIFQFQLINQTKEQHVLDYSFRISQETKHSLIQKFTLR